MALKRCFDTFGQHRVLQPGTLIAPGLTDFNGPFFIVRRHGEYATRGLPSWAA